MPTVIITDSDSFSYRDNASPLKVRSSDSFGWNEFQDDSGDIIIANSDSMSWTEAGYAQYAVNPFQEMQSITMEIQPYFEITLGLLAHL